MTTFITLISVALLAAMVTSSWGDLQESSPARDIEGERSLGTSPDEALERQQRAAGPPHRSGRPHRPVRPIRPRHRGRRSPSPMDRHRLHDPFHHHRGPRSAQPKISALEMQVTKGEYVCGDRICKLTPGEVPKNCPHGMCQYPIFPPAHVHHNYDVV